jgi:putative ABC transport system permease protein
VIRPGVRRFLRLAIWRRRLRAGEVDDEIRFHLEERATQLVRDQGLTLAEARAEALRRFGGLGEARPRLMAAARQREAHMRHAELLDALRQDLTYALRQLRRSPGFALAAVLTLALGIGVNATMFGVIDRLLLRAPAHVTDPARLMLFSYVRTFDGTTDDQEVFSYPLYRDLRETRAFEHVAAYSRTSLALGRGAEARSIRGMRVSASYFAALGVRPAVGRLFLPEDDGNPVAPPVTVLGYGFWQSHFGGDRGYRRRTRAIRRVGAERRRPLDPAHGRRAGRRGRELGRGTSSILAARDRPAAPGSGAGGRAGRGERRDPRRRPTCGRCAVLDRGA